MASSSSSPSSWLVPRSTARSILSLGIFSAFAERMAVRRRGFESGSAPPTRAAMVPSRITFLMALPRFASVATFLCLMVAHLECPDIVYPVEETWQEHGKMLLPNLASTPGDALVGEGRI